MKRWNNLSIKHKIWVLVIVPLLVIVLFASQKILSINQQVRDLSRATKHVDMLAQVSLLNSYSLQIRNIEDVQISAQFDNTVKEITQLAAGQTQFEGVDSLVEQFKEAKLGLAESSDIESRIEHIDWLVEVYQELLITLEKSITAEQATSVRAAIEVGGTLMHPDATLMACRPIPGR